MTTQQRAIVEELTKEESLALLERHHIGRLAFSFHDRVDIEPISYVASGEWIYARTAPGTKISTVQHHPWVAFEVDEARSQFEWESVVVRGTIYLLDPDGSRAEQQTYRDAVTTLRGANPETLTDADMTPHRTQVLRMNVGEISGRRSRIVHG